MYALFLLVSLGCSSPMATASDPAVTLGAPLPAVELPIQIPDPQGRTIVLELIRSADW